jgi:spore maturation protein CgeD
MIPIVSVILTSYNKPDTVGKAIESVINQTFQNWELFIMDDHSNRETIQVIEGYLHDKRIKFFNSNIKDNERYKTTRYATLINEALQKTKGKYISYLTDDNIYLPHRLQVMVDHFNQNPDIDIVYSAQRIKAFDESGVQTWEGVRETEGILTEPANKVDHCSVMHTKKIADLVFGKYGSFWDEDPIYWLSGDAAFWRRLAEFKPFYPISEVLDESFKFPESFQRLYLFLPTTLPDGILIKGLSSDIYLIDQQKRRKIIEDMIGKLNYSLKQVIRLPDPFMFKYEEGIPIDENVFKNGIYFPNMKLVRVAHSHKTYYIQGNKKHPIMNEQVLLDFKFKMDEVVVVDEHLLNQIQTGKPFYPLFHPECHLPDGILYKLENTFYISFNNKFHYIQNEVADKLNMDKENAVMINNHVFSKYEKGNPFVWITK